MVPVQAAVLWLAVSAGGETVLLDFTADWCGPCREMAPTVDQLAAKGYPVRKVNVDHHRDLAARHRVGPIPCFVMLVEGREVARHVGHTDLGRLEQMCLMGRGAARQAAAGAEGAARAAPVTKGGLPIPVVRLGAPSLPRAESAQEPPAPGAEAAAPAESAAADEDLIASTVRLRIHHGNSQSCGSGTIIDARQGQALVLTCGHIFRDSQGAGRIEVDLFGPNPAAKVPGRLVAWDDRRDVGLVTISPPGPVRAARVAPPGHAVAVGDRVASAGCNHGAEPTVRHSRVVSLDRYVGPPNLQTDDQPVEGRSGGGLFTPDGLVIGVCNAADPADRQGLFAAPGAIHAQLDDARLQFVYQDVPAMPRRMPRPSESDVAAAPSASAAAGPGPAEASAPGRGARPDSLPLVPAAPPDDAQAGPPAPLSREESAVLDEIRRRQAQGAEVIFIVRPLDAPQARSEVFVLNRASPALLDRLEGGAQTTEIRETSLAVLPRRARAEAPPPPPGPRPRVILPPPVPQP